MEPGILQTVGAAAGALGVALLVLLWLFREVIRKTVFPRMSEDRGHRTIRLLMILATVVALAGIGAWTFAQSGAGPPGAERRRLTVRIARVDLDWEGPAAAAKEFEGPEEREVAESAVDEASRWIVDRLLADGVLSPHERVTVTFTLPADLATQNPEVAVAPQVPWAAYAAAAGGGSEQTRMPVADSKTGWRAAGTWKPPGEPWELQVVPQGHAQVGIEIPTRRKTAALASPLIPAAVGLRDAPGSAEVVSDRILVRLIADPRLKVTRPEALEALRAEMAKAARAGEPTALQATLRSKLEVDYVVTCSVQ